MQNEADLDGLFLKHVNEWHELVVSKEVGKITGTSQ